jgi:hypothetical protein
MFPDNVIQKSRLWSRIRHAARSLSGIEFVASWYCSGTLSQGMAGGREQSIREASIAVIPPLSSLAQAP